MGELTWGGGGNKSMVTELRIFLLESQNIHIERPKNAKFVFSQNLLQIDTQYLA